MGDVSSKLAGIELEYLMGSWEEEEGRRHGSSCFRGLPWPLLGQGGWQQPVLQGERKALGGNELKRVAGTWTRSHSALRGPMWGCWSIVLGATWSAWRLVGGDKEGTELPVIATTFQYPGCHTQLTLTSRSCLSLLLPSITEPLLGYTNVSIQTVHT